MRNHGGLAAGRRFFYRHTPHRQSNVSFLSYCYPLHGTEQLPTIKNLVGGAGGVVIALAPLDLQRQRVS